MRVQLEKKPLSPNLDKYLEEFGHLPPSHLFRTKTLQDLDEMAWVVGVLEGRMSRWLGV